MRSNARGVVLATLLVAAAASPARAGIQKTKQQWGKVQLGLSPIGFQVNLLNNPTGYKLNVDVAGLVKEWGDLGLWVGGGVGYIPWIGCGGLCGHDVEIDAFAMLTINKLSFPLVPFVRAGLTGEAIVASSFGGTSAWGTVGVRFGGGAYYYLTRLIGLGGETNFYLGAGGLGGLVNAGVGFSSGVAFTGHWDFALGMRLSF